MLWAGLGGGQHGARESASSKVAVQLVVAPLTDADISEELLARNGTEVAGTLATEHSATVPAVVPACEERPEGSAAALAVRGSVVRHPAYAMSVSSLHTVPAG